MPIISKIYFGIIIFAALFMCGCTADLKEESGKSKYSILIGEYKKVEQAIDSKNKLNVSTKDSLHIEKLGDKKYILLYGYFPNSFEAGMIAFNLHSDGVIAGYKIIQHGKQVLDEYANILFVANYLDKPAVFNFNLITKQIEVEWSRLNAKVVALNHFKDAHTFVISTAQSFGKETGLSYVRNAKVFLHKRGDDQDKEIINLDDGVQLYTYWENGDTLKVNYSLIDSTDSKTLVQNIYSIDKNGILGVSKTRKYDLLQDGFPLPPKRIPVTLSPFKNYQFRIVSSQGKSYFYLKNLEKRSEELVASTIRTIYDARWSDDGNYLFIVTNNTIPENPRKKKNPSGELLVINAANMKLQKIFAGFQYQNILIQGRLLLFDQKLGNNSQIAVYDFIKDRYYYTISVTDGCGLNNLY
jgi:hypothetical protein